MAGDSDLLNLIRRLRERDPKAAVELVHRYEADIRRIARVRLARMGLKHLVDSEDIAQSVFGRFFARFEAGGLEFESPEKILHLLSVIASNRVFTHARRERRMVRPSGQAAGDSAVWAEAVADHQPGADRAVAARDELQWLLNSLGPADREILAARLEGKEWATLAAERGIGADALRKRLSRALDEVAGQMGVADSK